DGNAQKLRSLGYPSERITVVNNTTDIEQDREWFLSKQSRRDELRERIAKNNSRVLLMVGRLVPMRKTGFLAAMFRHIRTLDPRYHLIIVGDGPDAPIAHQLKQDLGDTVTVT